MASLYDKYKKHPERGCYLMIKYIDLATGREVRRKVGQVKPKDLKRDEYRAAVKDLWKIGKRRKLALESGQPPIPSPAKAKVSTLGVEMAEWVKKRTNHDAKHEKQRLKKRLDPKLGHLAVDQVGPAALVDYITTLLADDLSGPTIKKDLALLSRFYNDRRMTDGHLVNPVGQLDKATRAKLKSQHDPRDTPFIESKSVISGLYQHLPAHVAPAFAAGVFAGLRKGEIAALKWGDVDLARRRVTVRRAKVPGKHEVKSTKSGRIRVVPISDTLLPVLRAWKLACPATPGEWVFPSFRANTGRVQGMVDDHTWPAKLREAFAALEVEPVTWYQATRHTFASWWVQDGGTLEALREIMGHSTIMVTERYAHLRPDLFTEADLGRVSVDLSAAVGEVRSFTKKVTHLDQDEVGEKPTLEKVK